MDSNPAYLEGLRAGLAEDVARRISDPSILRAFERVPRHLFVPEAQRDRAYEDRPLPLFEDQTISQPRMIALMLEELAPKPGDRALEVGAGSGYAAAVLSCLVAEVHAVEIRPTLLEWGRRALVRAGITNVTMHLGDGSRGLPEHAPYDCILVSAGGAHVPEALVAELSPGGRIVIPVGDEHRQRLKVGRRTHDGVEWRDGVECIFVPLIES